MNRNISNKSNTRKQINLQNCYFDNQLSNIDPILLTSGIPEVFETFVRALSVDLQLQRAGFVIAHHSLDNTSIALSLIAISDNSSVCAGLGIEIPPENSILHELFESTCLKTIAIAQRFHGNFVERHALIVSENGSFGMYPLVLDGYSMGIVTLNCENRAVFENNADQINTTIKRLCYDINKMAPRKISRVPSPIEI